MAQISETTATANIEVKIDSRPLEEAMLVIAKHATACAVELAAVRGEKPVPPKTIRTWRNGEEVVIPAPEGTVA